MSRSWISPILDLERRLDELFDEVIYRRWAIPCKPLARKEWVPSADIHELPDAFLIEVDLPGLTPEDVRIEVGTHEVTISGDRAETSPETATASRRERPSGPFRRTLAFAEPIDAAHVKAVFDHGVVRILVPKARASTTGEAGGEGLASRDRNAARSES